MVFDVLFYRVTVKMICILFLPSLRSKRFRQGLGSKESQRNGIFGVLPARKMMREPKRGKRGRGGEG